MEQRHTRTVKVSEVLPAILTVTATTGRARGGRPTGTGRSRALAGRAAGDAPTVTTPTTGRRCAAGPRPGAFVDAPVGGGGSWDRT